MYEKRLVIYVNRNLEYIRKETGNICKQKPGIYTKRDL